MTTTIDQIIPGTGTLKLGLTEAALTQDVTCQYTSARLVGSPNLQDVPATGCQPASQVPGATSWAFEINWLQDISDPTGLSMWAFGNDTKQAFFEFEPFGTGAGTVKLTGELRVVAGPIGGQVDVALQTDAVTWPVIGKPEVIYTAAVMAADATEDDDELVEV
jgi:hypothetical protein